MILEDTTTIHATAKDVFSFFQHIDKHYTDWHTDHIMFKWIKVHELKNGNIFYSEENIGGQLMKKRVILTSVIPEKYIEFRPTNFLLRLFLPKMTFIITDYGDQCEFTGQVFIRGFGPLAKKLHSRQFQAIQQHMKDEGENLDKLISSSK